MEHSKTVDTRIVSDKTFTALEFSSRYLSGFLNFTSVPVFYVCTIGLPATKVTFTCGTFTAAKETSGVRDFKASSYVSSAENLAQMFLRKHSLNGK